MLDSRTERNRRGIGMTSERTRRRMLERLRARGIDDDAVLSVLGRVPRHWFVDEALAHRVYDDNPLPIGLGQTLSASYTVALMTSLLRAHAPARGLGRVLEIGTGSGYQTVVLAEFVQQLYTVERLEPLQRKAIARCRELGLQGIRFHLSDGHWGWPQHAPFDGILCAAAPDRVPPPLLEQLHPDGGVLVIPVGTETQCLHVVTRQGDDWVTEQTASVNFVPLVAEPNTSGVRTSPTGRTSE